MNRPYAGLQITGGADTLALSTTAAKFISWAATGGSALDDDTGSQGDYAVQADKANSRVLLQAPGTYRSRLVLTGIMASGADLIAVVRKNAVAITGKKAKCRITTNKGQIVFEAIFKIAASDLPQKQTPAQTAVQAFADPASTEFIGAGGAAKTMVPVDIALSVVTSTDTLTTEEAIWTVERLDG